MNHVMRYGTGAVEKTNLQPVSSFRPSREQSQLLTGGSQSTHVHLLPTSITPSARALPHTRKEHVHPHHLAWTSHRTVAKMDAQDIVSNIAFTTSGALVDCVDKKMLVVLRDGKKLIGVLRSYDQFGK